MNFKKPVDLRWLKRNSESVKEVKHGERAIYEISAMDLMGVDPIRISSRNPKTLCLSNFMLANPTTPDAGELERALQFKTAKNTSKWADSFRQVDGGMVTIAIPHQTIDLRAFERLGAGPDRAIKRIATHFKTLAVGLDWSDDSRIGIRIRIATADTKAAKLLLNDARMLHRYAKRVSAELKPNEGIVNAKFTRGMLDTMVMRQEDHADGSTSVDIRTASPLTLADVIGPLLAQ